MRGWTAKSPFHEIAHILLETSGVTKQNDRYIDSLTGSAKGVEVFANRFAAEFLVPSADLEQQLRPGPCDDQYVGQLAERYRVSREVVLRKLLERDLGERAYYEAKVEEWAKQCEEVAPKALAGTITLPKLPTSVTNT